MYNPDRYSEYGSGSTKHLNTDPIRIRIHNTAVTLTKKMWIVNIIKIIPVLYISHDFSCKMTGFSRPYPSGLSKCSCPCIRLCSFPLVLLRDFIIKIKTILRIFSQLYGVLTCWNNWYFLIMRNANRTQRLMIVFTSWPLILLPSFFRIVLLSNWWHFVIFTWLLWTYCHSYIRAEAYSSVDNWYSFQKPNIRWTEQLAMDWKCRRNPFC